MEFGDKNLDGIVKTLAENNHAVWWNTYRKKNGRIVLKVEFAEDIGSDQDLSSDFNPQHASYKRLSENQSKRNYDRAKKHRDQKDSSIELARNSEILHSTPVPHLDLSKASNIKATSLHCLYENSATHTPIENIHESLSREETISGSITPNSPDSSVFNDAVDQSFEQKIIVNKSSDPPTQGSNLDSMDLDHRSDCETESDNEGQCPSQYSKCFYSQNYKPIEIPDDDPEQHLVCCVRCRINFCTTCFRTRKRHKRHKDHLTPVSSLYAFSDNEWKSLVDSLYSES